MALPVGLRAFHHADFRRFFWSQLVAQTGTWMQTVAQSWLVLQLTPSPFKLGLIGSLQFAPILLFSIASGALADRVRKRRLLIARFGVVPAFVLNGLGFAVAVVMLLGLRTEGAPRKRSGGGGLHDVRTGLRFAFSTPEIRLTMGLLFLVSICVFNFTVYVPLVVRTVLHLGAEGFGLLMACLGVGAVTGALTVGALGARRPPTGLLFGAAFLACAALVTLSTARVFWFAAIAL